MTRHGSTNKSSLHFTHSCKNYVTWGTENMAAKQEKSEKSDTKTNPETPQPDSGEDEAGRARIQGIGRIEGDPPRN